MEDKYLIFNEILAEAVAAVGYEYVGCECLFNQKPTTLKVYIDSPKGITVGDCEKASRQISAVLDVEGPLLGAYVLEVSSPGLERPLFTLEQFRRFIGHKVKLSLRIPLAGQRRFSGEIHAVTQEHVVLRKDDTDIELVFANIAKANLVA